MERSILSVAAVHSSDMIGAPKMLFSKSAFSEGVGHSECTFLVDEDVARNPPMYR